MTIPTDSHGHNFFQGSHNLGGGFDSMMPMLTNSIITITGMRDGNIMNAIIGIIILSMFNKIMGVLPLVTQFLYGQLTGFWNRNKMNSYASLALSSISTPQKKPTGTIIYEKIKDTASDNVVVSALINYISSLDTCKFLIFNCDYYVGNNEEFQLKPDILCRIIKYGKDDKGKINEYIFEIFSYVYDTEYLKNFVSNIVTEYNNEKTNNLGKQSYFFNEIYEQIPKSMDGTYRFEMSRKNVSFDMVPFHTNKSLRNVFGEHLAVVKRRIDTFINNPRWYEEKGIPYTLGIMLSGPPGTGKTSLIKAIAKDTRRHIFNINLRETTTQTQLKNLFYNQEIHIVRNGNNEVVNIPLEKRLYVIEDIDCLTDVVISRALLGKKLSDGDLNSHSMYSNNVVADNLPRVRPSIGHGINNYSPSDTTTNKHVDLDEGVIFDKFFKVEKLGQNPQSESEELDCDENKVINQYSKLDEFIAQTDSMHTTGLQGFGSNPFSANAFYGGINSNLCFIDNLPSYQDKPKKTMQDIIKEYKLDVKQEHKLDMKEEPSPGDISACEDEDKQTRNWPVNKKNKKKSKKTEPEKHPEQLNLAFLLNLLDGVLETPGRILIITTNHPERLDPALIRPGRIDIHLNVGNCSPGMIIDILRFFYNDLAINIPDWNYNIPITPAEVNKIILNNFDNPDGAIKEILANTQ